MEVIKFLVYMMIVVYVVSEIMQKKSIIYKIFIVFVASYIILILVLLKDLWYKIFLSPQISLILPFIAYGLIVKTYKNIRNMYYDKISKTDINTLQRDINMEYNPSIAGYLMNQTLEFKDLYADILNLYAKKIIQINKTEEEVFSYGENYAKEKNYLKYSDIYILENIGNKFSQFDFNRWEKIVRDEYKQYGFSKERKNISDKTIYIGNIIIIILFTIILSIIFKSILSGFMGAIGIALIYDFINYIIYNNKDNRYIYLTTKGKKEIKNCMKLKRFMKEYTLLKDRKLEEVNIYERYIPYAIALGVNTQYEEEIFEKETLKKIMQQINNVEYYEEN